MIACHCLRVARTETKETDLKLLKYLARLFMLFESQPSVKLKPSYIFFKSKNRFMSNCLHEKTEVLQFSNLKMSLSLKDIGNSLVPEDARKMVRILIFAYKIRSFKVKIHGVQRRGQVPVILSTDCLIHNCLVLTT